MIAHEHIQMIRPKSIIFTLIVAVITALLIFLSNLFFSPTASFIISLIFLVAGMNFVVYLIKKVGIATLFYVFTAILTFWINDIGVLGWKKILVFFFAGLIFEIIFLFLKLHLHNVQLDMVVGTSLSAASISLFMAFALSEGLASSFPIGLLNLIILAMAVGLGASVVTFLLWHNIERMKPVLKLESYLMSLAR